MTTQYYKTASFTIFFCYCFSFFFKVFYFLSLQDKWKEVGMNDSQIAEAKSKFTEAVKKVLPKIGDMQFFMGM